MRVKFNSATPLFCYSALIENAPRPCTVRYLRNKPPVVGPAYSHISSARSNECIYENASILREHSKPNPNETSELTHQRLIEVNCSRLVFIRARLISLDLQTNLFILFPDYELNKYKKSRIKLQNNITNSISWERRVIRNRYSHRIVRCG